MKIPLFWEITFTHHMAMSSLDFLQCIRQWGFFILCYFPLLILLIFAIEEFVGELKEGKNKKELDLCNSSQ